MSIIAEQSLKRLLVLFLLSLNLYSCAQSRNVVVRSYAFYIERSTANFPDYGNDVAVEGKTDTLINLPQPGKIDTSIVIYIETKTKGISWDTAWQKGEAYFITALPIDQIPFQAGNLKSGNEMVITPAKGNFLWQLQLSPTGGSKKMNKDKIILKGRYQGKTITWKTGSLADLIPLPSY